MIHLETKKHKNKEMFQDVSNNRVEKSKNIWICSCRKKYKYHQSYYRHKKMCEYKKTESKEEANETVLKLITENKEIMNLLLHLWKFKTPILSKLYFSII